MLSCDFINPQTSYIYRLKVTVCNKPINHAKQSAYSIIFIRSKIAIDYQSSLKTLAKQFYIFYFMHYLSELIIERIDLIKQLEDKLQKQNSYLGSTTSIQAELQLNKKIMRQYSIMKKREKQRILNEAEILQELRDVKLWQNKVLEDVLIELSSFQARHHSQYLSLLESGLTTAQQLQKLFQHFAQENHNKDYKIHIQKVKNMQITQFTPAYLLNWICEWSRINFREVLKKALTNEFQRHEQELKRISSGKNSSNETKQKSTNPLCISTHIAKSCENIPLYTFTNKQSVFGLFLQQLGQYYKQLPLQLDMNFIKSIKKLHSKGNQFEREDNLARAIDILIQSKNKHIKDQMQLFHNRYYQKYPKLRKQKSQNERMNASQSQSKVERNVKKINLARDVIFQRIKSQNNQENSSIKVGFYPKSKDSLLLCPKQAQINFDISKSNLSKKHKPQKLLQLPQIFPTRNHSKPVSTKNKPVSFMYPVNKSLISNFENALLRSAQKGKQYEYKQSQSIEKMYRKNNYSCTNETKLEIFQNPENISKKVSQVEANTNRKLMLQLLRQKNKYIFLEK